MNIALHRDSLSMSFRDIPREIPKNLCGRKSKIVWHTDARTMVTLGGYGGYIVVGFDHTIVNRPGEYDFKILGNAFYANDNPRPDAPLGGSSEPGIVMVSVDTNGNGVPDDEWYELAGSEYYKKETLKNYEITYYRPDETRSR